MSTLLLGAVGCDRSPFPVRELRGAEPGPTVTLVAGVHGGKRAATEAVRHLTRTLDGRVRRGMVLLVPVAHPAAAGSWLAQLSPVDSLNLNRVFPGRADGRPTEQLAHRLMRDIVARSDYLVDLHGSDGEEMVGAFAYAARPGLDPRVDSLALHLATLWGTPRVVWDTEGPRTLATSRFLQTAAHLSGVPAITLFEAGTASDDAAATDAFERGALRLLAGLGLIDPIGSGVASASAPILHARRDVTLAPASGAWTPAIRPGQSVSVGELLGMFVDSTGVSRELRASVAGVALHVRHATRVQEGTALTILAVLP